MSRHLLDTDILIWILRGKSEALEFIHDLMKEEVPAISSLAFYEVWAGAKVKESETITAFLLAFSVLPVTKEITKEGADYYRQYRSKGITLSTVDALIAATARYYNLILVTENLLDFPMRDIEKRSL